MLKSCISNIPEIVQRLQFKIHAKVNGSGMEFAFFVVITFLIDDRGLENRTTQKNTASFPITSAGSGTIIAKRIMIAARKVLTLKWSSIVPGS